MPSHLTSIFSAIALSTLLSVAHAERSDSQKIMELLHATCIQSASNNYAEIDDMVKAFEGKAMPDKYINGDPAISQMGGKGYWVKYDGLQLGLAYAINGGCTVMVPKINPAEMQDTLKDNYPLHMVHTESTGPQVQINFKIENPSLYAGAMLLVTYAKPQMQNGIGSVGFIPAAAIRAKAVEPSFATSQMPPVASKNTKELGVGTEKQFPRENQLTQIVKSQLNFSAKLTKQEHTNFWRIMNTFTPVERTHLLRMIEVNFSAAAKHNIALLESAVISAASGKSVKTSELIESTAETRRIYLTTLPPTLSPSQKEDLIKAYDSRRAIADKNNDIFLKSAAAGRPLAYSEQQFVAFDPESLRTHSAASRQAFKRVQKLLDPVWTD